MNIVCDEFDSTKYCLGGICRRGHEWGNSGKGLRYIKGYACLKCLKMNPVPPDGGTIEKRFWEKVDKSSDCWEWTATVNHNGYGMVSYKGKNQTAHRVAWQLAYGKIPENMCICHVCDNRKCVRLDHLWLGTFAENNADRAAKGRNEHTRGINHPKATLTEEQVKEIRIIYIPGKITLKSVAQLYGVSLQTIWRIVNRQVWTHI